jgi:predicted ATPase
MRLPTREAYRERANAGDFWVGGSLRVGQIAELTASCRPWSLPQGEQSMNIFQIHEFTPLCLTMDRIGPFQAQPEAISFTDNNGESCNFHVLYSKNGRGKTTILELIAALMGMTGFAKSQDFASAHGRSPDSPFGLECLNHGAGWAQLDFRIRYNDGGDECVAVLSMFAGQMDAETNLRPWDEEMLDKVGAQQWHRFGFCRDKTAAWSTIGLNDEWVANFISGVDAATGEKVGGFEESLLDWPTVIYFSAYRNIVSIGSDQHRAIVPPRDWNYAPSYSFGAEGGGWRDSLDNLLVWLKWLDDGRFDRAVKLINDRVFAGTRTSIKEVRKDPHEVEVVRNGNVHRLDELSNGEKSLVQLFLRIGSYMTRNTILLIDEPEAHLHEEWQQRLLLQLKKMAQEQFPGLTIILATHSAKIMDAFELGREEDNLRKGCNLCDTVDIKANFPRPPERIFSRPEER